MIVFDRSKFHPTKDGGIYLSYSQIDELTDNLLQDYNPSALTNPQAIEYDDFLECYLEVNLDYQHIYATGKQGDILGCALFSKQSLPVFDQENMCKAYRLYDPIAVVLDLSLVEGNRKIQENITGLHEAGHIWLQKDEFMDIDGQISLNGLEKKRICCRKDDMETFEQNKCTNGEMWREWQATTFAVTLALPRKSLEISVKDLFKRYGISGSQLIYDEFGVYNLAHHTIPFELSKIYNMSKEAIRYRLEKTGFYITKKKYEEEHAQLSIFDFL